MSGGSGATGAGSAPDTGSERPLPAPPRLSPAPPLTDGGHLVREKQRARAEPGRRGCRLRARVAAPDHQDVVSRRADVTPCRGRPAPPAPRQRRRPPPPGPPPSAPHRPAAPAQLSAPRLSRALPACAVASAWRAAPEVPAPRGCARPSPPAPREAPPATSGEGGGLCLRRPGRPLPPGPPEPLLPPARPPARPSAVGGPGCRSRERAARPGAPLPSLRLARAA